MLRVWFWRAFLVAASVSIVGGGCNLFAGMEPPSRSIDALVDDARAALMQGKNEEAVRHLETAFQMDSSRVEVRVELANALVAAREIDLFSLRAALDPLAGESTGASDAQKKRSRCTVDPRPDPDDARYTSLSMEDPRLQSIVEHGPLFRRVQHLVVEGVLQGRPEVFADVSARLRMKGFLLAALAQVGHRLHRTIETFRATESSLYLDGRTTPPTLLVCAPDSVLLAALEGRLCALDSAMDQALSWLERRGEIAGRGPGTLVTEHLTATRATLRGGLSCGESSRARRPVSTR